MLDRSQTSVQNRLRVHRDWRDIRGLWPSLSDLGHGVSGFPFQCREWVDAYIATMAPGETSSLFFPVVETSDGLPIAFFPLQIRRRMGLRLVEFIGARLADYSAPLMIAGYDEALISDAFWSQVKALGPSFDIVSFRHAPARVGNAANPLLTAASNPATIPGRAATLNGDWACFYARTHSKATRSKLRRKRQNLAEGGPVSFALARDTSEALEILDELFLMKARSLCDSENTLSVPEYADFYRMMTRTAPAHVRVHALRVNGEIIAALWGLETDGRFTSLLASHAGGTWSRFSPGLLAFEDLFQWCYAKGIGVFDFGLGEEAYKLRWCDQDLNLRNTLQAFTIAGHAATFVLRHKAGLGPRTASVSATGTELAEA